MSYSFWRPPTLAPRGACPPLPPSYATDRRSLRIDFCCRLDCSERGRRMNYGFRRVPKKQWSTWGCYWFLLRYRLYTAAADSFIHSGHFYSAPSSTLLLRGAPDYSTDTVSEFHAEAHRQLQVKDFKSHKFLWEHFKKITSK